MERPIEGPEPYTPWLTSKEAGTWLGGIGEKLFEKLMAEHLSTVRPVFLGKYKHWAWMDVAVLAYVLRRANTAPPQGNVSDED